MCVVIIRTCQPRKTLHYKELPHLFSSALKCLQGVVKGRDDVTHQNSKTMSVSKFHVILLTSYIWLLFTFYTAS